MDKIYVKHYIVATYGNTNAGDYRVNAMHELLFRFEAVSERIIAALHANNVENPESIITYSFRMLGDHHDDVFHRREMVEVDFEALKKDPSSFPWHEWGWVQAFQPIIDVAGYTIVEIDSEYQSFGPDPTPEVDYVQPCYRIYEKGRPEYVRGGFSSTRDKPAGEETEGFYEKVILPIGQSIKENAPTLIAIGSAVVTFAVMWRTTQHMERDMEEKSAAVEDVLHHLEELVEDVIDMPQVVKVEFPDDSEAFGLGRRTW